MNWQCRYCDTVIEARPTDAHADRSRQHLLDHHRTELEARFRRE